MSSDSITSDGLPARSELAETEDYKVGPGRPPKEHRFKKGAPSPNPNGRPRRQRTSPDLRKELEGQLAVKVPVKMGDKFVSTTKGALGIHQLVNQYAKGDRHARRDLMEIAAKLGVNLFAGIDRVLEQALAPNHSKLLEAYLEQRKQFAEKLQSHHNYGERTYAPPDLTD